MNIKGFRVADHSIIREQQYGKKYLKAKNAYARAN